ncbi:MAG: hypothetical protein ACLFP2_00930 [Candidatus Woesearchaeota archaeon]
MSLEQRIERIFQYHKEGLDLSGKERTLTILYDCSSQSANNLQELVFRMKRKADFSKIGEFLHPIKLFPRDNPDNAYSFKGEKKIIRDYEKSLRKQGAQIPRSWSSKGMRLYTAQQFFYLCSLGPVTVKTQEKKGIRNHLFRETRQKTQKQYTIPPKEESSEPIPQEPQYVESDQAQETKEESHSQNIDPAKLKDAKKLIKQTRKHMKDKDYEKATHNLQTLKDLYTEAVQYTLKPRELRKINSIHSNIHTLEEDMKEEFEHLRLKLPDLVKRNDFQKITSYTIPPSEEDIHQYINDINYFTKLRESLIEYKRTAELLQKGEPVQFQEKHQHIMELIEQRPQYKETFNSKLISDIEDWTQKLKAYEQGQEGTS